MTGKHHAVAGLCVAGCVTVSAVMEQQIPAIPVAGAFIAAFVGSLFPDIDTRTSIISKRMKITSAIVSKLFGHRGLFHSPIFAGVVYFICWLLFQHYNITEYSCIYVGFVVGMLTHITCDMCTKGGIPLLYPASRATFRIFTLPSGSKYEPVTLTAVCITILATTAVMLYFGIYISAMVL